MNGSRRNLILAELNKRKCTIWELLARWHRSLPEFIKLVNELFEKGLITSDGKYLYPKHEIKRTSIEHPFEIERCRRCEGKVVLPSRLKEFSKRFENLVRGRPKPDTRFSQGYMRSADVIARVAFMCSYGDVEEKKIVLVGDDDLVSVALILTGLPKKVTVLDIDERLGDFLDRLSRRKKLDVEFVHYDVVEPLPQRLVGKYDVFLTDPLDTLSGFRAFLSRGASCLKLSGGSGYFGLSTLEASFKKMYQVERFLLDMNFTITDILGGHSWYPTKDYGIGYPYEEDLCKNFRFEVDPRPNVVWYKSSFIRIESVGKIRPIIRWNEKTQMEISDPETLAGGTKDIAAMFDRT